MFSVRIVPGSGIEFAEPMGTKFKFWYDDPEFGRTLFKATRPGHGEDWAEKAAQELAGLIGVPAARYELAVWHDKLGVVSPRFVAPGETLVHGNELLAGVDAQYAMAASVGDSGRSSPYSVERVLETLQWSGARPRPNWQLPDEVSTAADVFAGYLIVDAWIGNTDRHHENWAVVDAVHRGVGTTRDRLLAPLFDSASCLGRNEPDENRARRLATGDRNDTVEAYAIRARSAFHGAVDQARRLSPVDAFRRAAAVRPGAARAWLKRLAAATPGDVESLFARFPDDRVSALARAFAMRMLHFNPKRLLALASELEGMPPRDPHQR